MKDAMTLTNMLVVHGCWRNTFAATLGECRHEARTPLGFDVIQLAAGGL